MLKNDITFIEKTCIAGNELVIYHPGAKDDKFIKGLIVFLLTFEYEITNTFYNEEYDYSVLTFEWKGILEDEDESEALRGRRLNDL